MSVTEYKVVEKSMHEKLKKDGNILKIADQAYGKVLKEDAEILEDKETGHKHQSNPLIYLLVPRWAYYLFAPIRWLYDWTHAGMLFKLQQEWNKPEEGEKEDETIS